MVNYRLVPRSATSVLAEPSRKKANILLPEARRKPHNTTRNKKPFIRNNISPLPNGQFTDKLYMTHKGSLAPPWSILVLRPSPALCQREGLGRECQYSIPTVREYMLDTLGFWQPPLWRRWLVPRSATSLLAEPSREKDNILLLEACRKPRAENRTTRAATTKTFYT